MDMHKLQTKNTGNVNALGCHDEIQIPSVLPLAQRHHLQYDHARHSSTLCEGDVFHLYKTNCGHTKYSISILISHLCSKSERIIILTKTLTSTFVFAV